MKMVKSIALSLILVISSGPTNIALSDTATCVKNVQRLDGGQVAPCSGYLFSPEMEFKVRIQNQTYTKLEELTKQQDELNQLLKERLQLEQKRNIELVDKIHMNKQIQWWQNVGAFILGAVITGYVAGQTAAQIR